MFHPFKRLERSWNAHTPKFLHNRTKENFIFQLVLVVIIILVPFVKDWVEERRQKREDASWDPRKVHHLKYSAGQR